MAHRRDPSVWIDVHATACESCDADDGAVRISYRCECDEGDHVATVSLPNGSDG